MRRKKTRLEAPVTLFVAIEEAQHERLRHVAFAAHRSLADVVRQALTEFLARAPEADPEVAAPAEQYPSPFHARVEHDSGET